MSFRLRNICSVKLKGVPLVNSIFKNIPLWNQELNKHTSFEENENELNILCVQNLFSYNSGFLGFLINKLGFYLPSTSIIKYLLKNYESNDIEFICFLLSMVSRTIPFNNFFIYDFKSILCDNLPFINQNLSFHSVYNLKSLFCFKPVFDSGSAIFSNKKADDTGFIPWKNNDNSYYNKGMIWCLFKKDTTGIMIINVDCIESSDSCFQELVELKTNLEEKFGKDLDGYETYITGNFNKVLNMYETLPEVRDSFNLLKNANIEIINNKDLSTSEFILYSKFKSDLKYDFVDMSVSDLDYKIHKYDIQPQNNFTINPVFNMKIEYPKKVEIPNEESPKNKQEISLNPLSFFQTIKESYFDVRSDTSEKSNESWEQV